MALSKDEKKVYQQIKKLVQSRDFKEIEEGIQLAKESANGNVFDELLGEFKFRSDGYFVNDWKASGPDEYYFSVALQGLVNYAPDGSKGQLFRASIETLRLKGQKYNLRSRQSMPLYAKYLSNFSNIKNLSLVDFYEIIGFNEIYHLNLESLTLKGIENANYISGNGMEGNGIFPCIGEKWQFKTLQNLEIDLPRHKNDPEKIIYHVDFLGELENLRSLKITGPSSSYNEDPVEFSIVQLKGLRKLGSLILNTSVKTLDALSEMHELKFLSIKSELLDTLSGLQQLNQIKGLNLRDCQKLQDISQISNLNALEYVDFNCCSVLSNLKPLENIPELQYINIQRTSVKSLEGLNQAEKLRAIEMQQTQVENLDSLSNSISLEFVNAEDCKQLNSIKALKIATNLKELILKGCSSLLSLEGLENVKNLKAITLNRSGIKNVDALSNCTQVFNNIGWNDDSFKSFDEFFSMYSKLFTNSRFSRIYVSELAGDYYKNRKWGDPKMNEFIIGNCPNLESLEGLKNAGIQLLRLGKCPNFKNTDSLSEFELLQCCDFSDSALLESVQALANLPLIDRLILGKCGKVRPKPRFLKMDSYEKVNEYLSKFKKDKPKVKISSDKKELNEKLKSLLLANDHGQIDLGLELAQTISDDEIFSVLLQDIKFVKGQLIPNSTFLGNDKEKSFRTYALEGLLSIASDNIDVAKKYRGLVTSKVIQGPHISSLISISGLTNIRELTLYNTSLKVLSDLQKLQNIEKLVLKKNIELADLSGLSGLKSLKSLEIEECGVIDLKHICDFPNLSSIIITRCNKLSSTSGIGNLKALDTINVDSNAILSNVDAMGSLNSLKVISMNDCSAVMSIKSLAQLKGLEVLYIRNHNLNNLEGLSSLVAPILEGLKK